MPEKGAPRTRRRTWPVAAVAVAVLAASSVTWFAVARAEEREERLDANRELVTRGCAGLLREEMYASAPDDARGALDEYGTLLRPGEESRALLDCTLAWGDGDGGTTAGVRARVRAEAVPERTSPGSVTGDFGLPLPPSATGSVGTADRPSGGGPVATASLLVDCPKGLHGRGRTARDLLVSVDLPSAADGADVYGVPGAERLAVARTAAKVTNWVARKQGCGSEPLRTEPGAAPAKTPALCAWLSPEGLGSTPGKWSFDGNDTTYNRRTGTCGGQWDDTAGSPGHLTVRAAGAQSWSGVLAAGAYEEYADKALVPDPKAPSGHDKSLAVQQSDDDPQLALWARSECVAGPTYHRVWVTPAFDFDRGPADGETVLGPKDRRRLSRHARTVLDRYLSAPDGWPKRSHCRGTEIVGEVAEWRGRD
ncbi:hypothetical protein [Streptomyces venezuelae]|uniref:Uncharacterized protein n=1 Tax=Streptomyces venezuelae TaxID=54571 RepID=A0A5P2BJA4_STRVZ|nr:hypothetical protein [Streptomyces venezuelae]QES30177.1 hypothetical protein DEJ47_30415 [Streptomyces venezuelae]